ncbi:MAG: hypothetical protein GY953_45760 [bacterium]|nr:hypothetical protein [bacterium]
MSWDADEAARRLDAKFDDDVSKLELPAPNVCFSEIRAYLQTWTNRRRIRSFRHLSRKVDGGDWLINAGPTMQKGPHEEAIQFRSGAQLSSGVTLRRDVDSTRLVACRFHLLLPQGSGLAFVRIDLNPANKEEDALREPRSHLHPGFPHVHLPFPVLRPLEVLDRLFHVVEPTFVA